MPQFSVIIPALNELGIIRENAEALARWMHDNLPDQDFEVLVVDDGSTDGMGEMLDEAVKTRPWLRVVHHPRNLGRGRAIRTGFDATNSAYVVCMDADLSYGPDHISDLLEPLKQESADITLASAYHPEGRVTGMPFQRALLSRLGNRILSHGLDRRFYTVTCVVRGFRRDVIDDLELINDGKELHLEIINKAIMLGYRVKEVPAHLKWPDHRRSSDRKGFLPDLKVFSMRQVILSHLVFNYMTSPGVLLYLPILALLAITLLGTGVLTWAFIGNLATPAFALTPTGIYQALRQTLIDGNLTFLLTFFTLIMMLIFVAFYFISAQARNHFQEIYVAVIRMNRRLRRLEGRLSCDESDSGD